MLRPHSRLVSQLICLLAAWVGGGLAVAAQTPGEKPLVLISEANSTRAIAFESTTFRKEPFELSTPLASDGRTRIMVFALNLALNPNEDKSAITADAETADQAHHVLQVEYAAPLATLPWLSSIVLRLSDDLVVSSDVLIGLTLHGVKSNRVRIGIGGIGGGPPDDAGAGPTLAPPYLISGRVTTANGAGLSGVSLILDGDQVQAITTDDSGSYSFLINTFGSYTLNATKAFFNLTPATRSFNNLSNSYSNINFAAVRQTHNVSGKIFDNHSSPLGGIALTLADNNNVAISTITTSSDGGYAFANLPAGFDYRLTAAPTTLLAFTPQTITALDRDLVLNFAAAPRRYTISGRVVDSNNAGVTGISLILSGSETAKTRSDSNGNYSLSATVLGNYTVTAAIEQDYCTFAPVSQSVVNLIGDRVFNYNVTFKPVPDPQQVLEFDGTQKTVDYGPFWPEFTNLGPFFWEFWAMPGTNAGATYMLSDGYGGLHALLFGFSNLGASEPNRYEMSGNINDGIGGSSHIFSFGSDSGPTAGEWCHLAVGWDGQNIITYMNGVPVGKKPYALPRQSTGPGGGAGRLLIGGSDHANFRGRIAQVRGYENSNPRMNTSVESSFAPETVFSREGNMLSYYFLATPIVADFSRGYLTGSHVGVPRGTTAGILGDCGSCPPPQFVVDTTAPNFATNVAPQPVAVPTPFPVPNGALVFDSFSRPNSTYMFGGKGGLGSTEGGTAGPQVWQMKADADQFQPFGILNGRAVLLGGDTSVGWVNTGSTSGNLDVRVIRTRGRWGSGIDTGLSFRLVDQANYFFAHTSDSIASPGNQFVNVGYFLNGSRSMIASGVIIPNGWTTLRVITRAGGSLQVFVDATQVFSTNIPTLANANKAGLFNNAGGLGLVNRWDNFIVFDAGP
ncbi:MAG TPA: carboxypeptidase regulatory-like domain-containing protein [Pyrinomonadaceae bacterium]|nr:carboxypeptidase regulatory-like domain-containing protein [Pyrinomonadaceae bacterium]